MGVIRDAAGDARRRPPPPSWQVIRRAFRLCGCPQRTAAGARPRRGDIREGGRLGVQNSPIGSRSLMNGSKPTPVQIGGSRLSWDRGASPTRPIGPLAAVTLSDGQWPPDRVAPVGAVTGRLRQRRRRQCRWHAGRGCRGPGRTASSCAGRRATRLPARRAAGPRHQARQ